MTPDPTNQTEALIIGAGPAGLAVGACLQRAGIPFILLEAAQQVGASWRNHYERLHLHTDKHHSQLPYFPYPRYYPRYPSRAQVVDYLEAYARHFDLQPRFGQKVCSVQRAGVLWQTRTADTLYLSPNVIVASGNFRQPIIPTWPGQESFGGEILHSSAYRSGRAFAGKRVLVVGFGNSGGEIALDLYEQGATPALAVRSAINLLPRDLLGLPLLDIAIPLSHLPPRLADLLVAPVMRLRFGDLTRLGLRKLPYGPYTQIKSTGQIPPIDIGTVALMRAGHLPVYPGIERFEAGTVVFSNGQRQPFDAIILATGFRPALADFIEESALQGEQAGLYFCGFHATPTGMLRAIAAEAKDLAQDIINKQKESSKSS